MVTINIPRLALRSSTVEDFFTKLDEVANLAIEALHVRVNRLRGVKAKVAPILYCEGACGKRLDPEEEIFQLFDNKRASISLGFIGLHEAATVMFKDEPHTARNAKKQDFCMEIVRRLKERTKAESEYTNLGFGLYATPSESLCYRFCSLDKQHFGDNVAVEKGYYTNSFHLDVMEKVDPFTKIDFEVGYPQYSSSGFISYVELPNMEHNLKGLERIWDYAYTRVPYFGTNMPIDACQACGFTGETKATKHGFECPFCGNTNSETLSVVRRVCGYLGAPNARPFNTGKQAEVMSRVKHNESSKHNLK